MTFLVAVVAGAAGGVLGAWLEQKYGPIVILWYVLALLAMLVALRFVK